MAKCHWGGLLHLSKLRISTVCISQLPKICENGHVHTWLIEMICHIIPMGVGMLVSLTKASLQMNFTSTCFLWVNMYRHQMLLHSLHNHIYKNDMVSKEQFPFLLQLAGCT